MTPKAYLDRYTYLKFYDPYNFMQVSAGLTNYGSGKVRHGSCRQGAQMTAEYNAFVAALRMKHHGNRNTSCGEVFYFNQLPTFSLISPGEDFYSSSFNHVFDGKGSPDEIIDTLRIAVLIGRIGILPDAAGGLPAALTAQDYVRQLVTLDCNGFAGNYFGGNPSAEIKTFAAPARKRTRASDVRVGDAVVTHSKLHPYEHIGVIADWFLIGHTATVRVAEWGWFGGEPVHYAASANHLIEPNMARDVDRPQDFGVGWKSKSAKDNSDTYRYIYAPPAAHAPHGWP